jgi:uncharacterized repeat protein (TIGR01451 family)
VVFSGTEQVSAAGIIFNDVIVNAGSLAAGMTLIQGPLVVTGQLQLIGGKITTGASKVVIGPAGTVVRTGGHVAGALQKHIPAGSPITETFEIGSASTYLPVTINFGTVVQAGDLTVASVAGDHPDVANSGVAAALGVNRWWTIVNGGASFDTADVTLTFAPGDIDPAADPNIFIVAKLDGLVWTQPSVTARSGTSITAAGMTSFSQFVVGQAAADVGVSLVGVPEPVVEGGSLTYTLGVVNGGPSGASNVVLAASLPSEVTFLSVSSSQGACFELMGFVTCLLGALGDSGSATVTVTAAAATPGSGIATASVSADEVDVNLADNTANWTSQIQAPPTTTTQPPSTTQPSTTTTQTPTTTSQPSTSTTEPTSTTSTQPSIPAASTTTPDSTTTTEQPSSSTTGHTATTDQSSTTITLPEGSQTGSDVTIWALVISGLLATLLLLAVRWFRDDRA